MDTQSDASGRWPPGVDRVAADAEPSPGWASQAGFSLFFESMSTPAGERIWRTRLYHDETDEHLTVAGMASTGWLGWVEARRPVVGVELPDRPVHVEIGQVRVAEATAVAPDVTDVRVEIAVRIVGSAGAHAALDAAVISAALTAWRAQR